MTTLKRDKMKADIKRKRRGRGRIKKIDQDVELIRGQRNKP
jgi:hypothetical protein